MSTSLLYHACGIRGCMLTKTEFSSGMMLFFLEAQPQHCRCLVCGSRNVIRRGSQTRWFRNVPFGTHLTWIVIDLPRVECRQCQVVRQIKIGFAEPRRHFEPPSTRVSLGLLWSPCNVSVPPLLREEKKQHAAYAVYNSDNNGPGLILRHEPKQKCR